MRITGGAWRSRRLKGPGRGMPLRPTPDALRERAFAVLGGRVAGARFLDLYAGTGAVALEALSRGAAAAVLVEHHRAAARLVRANLEALGVAAPAARLLIRSALRAVAELALRGETFDLVWADPPFASWREGLEVLHRAVGGGLVTSGGLLCLECPADADLAALPPPLELVRDLAGGASRVAILTIRAGGPPESSMTDGSSGEAG